MTGAGVTGLADFVPMERKVRLRAGTVTVKPLTLRQLPTFSRAVQPVLPFLLAGQVVAALTENGEALIAAICAATGMGEDDLPADPAEFVALAGAVVEVNVDFFARSLLPADQAAGAAIRAVTMAPDGALSSPGSVNADTGLTTSSG